MTACVLGALGVVLGALGAHALKKVLDVDQLTTFEVGVRYQMYHALFLLFIGTTHFIHEKAKKIVFYLVVVGVVFFSGSIYLLATNNLTSFDFKVLGPITPIGGVLMILGWAFTAYFTLSNKKSIS